MAIVASIWAKLKILYILYSTDNVPKTWISWELEGDMVFRKKVRAAGWLVTSPIYRTRSYMPGFPIDRERVKTVPSKLWSQLWFDHCLLQPCCPRLYFKSSSYSATRAFQVIGPGVYSLHHITQWPHFDHDHHDCHPLYVSKRDPHYHPTMWQKGDEDAYDEKGHKRRVWRHLAPRWVFFFLRFFYTN